MTKNFKTLDYSYTSVTDDDALTDKMVDKISMAIKEEIK